MADGNNPADGTRFGSAKQSFPMRALSYVISRAQMSRMVGGTDLMGRNVYNAFGYPNSVSLEQILFRYERGGIARRIVDAFPDATWGAPPEVFSDNPEFMTKWAELNNNFDFWTVLHRLDILSRLGQYATLLIGTDKGAMERPLKGARKMIYLQPYGQLSVRIKKFDTDPTSPRFQKPEIYEINTANNRNNDIGYQTPAGKPWTSSFPVHFSRMVHVAQRILEDEVYGSSVLVSVWNYLIDLEKVGGAAAENFWTSANRGMQLDVDKEMELSPEDAKDLSDEVDEYVNNLRRIIRTRGIKINPLGGEIADPKGTVDVIIDLISGTTGIPRRILLGTESGHLASTQDKGNWAERIEEYRLLTATPYILDPFIWALVDAGLLPNPGKYFYMWPDAYRVGPNDRGMQAAQTSRTAANLARMQKDWQGLVIQRMQLRKTPEPTKVPTPTPGSDVPSPGRGTPPKANAERTPIEDDLAHEASGQQGKGFGAPKGKAGAGAMQQTVNPAQLPVDLPDLPDTLLSYDEIRRIIGLSTDGRVLDQKVQIIQGRSRPL